MAAKSHDLDYENDDDAREIDAWLANLRKYRPPLDGDDDEVQCLSSGPSMPRRFEDDIRREVCSKPNKRPRLPSSSSASTDEHICYLDETTKTLHDTHPQIRDDTQKGLPPPLSWIWADNPNRGGKLSNDVARMEREFESIKARHADDLKKITIDMVLDLASRHEVVCGKWMVSN